MLKERVKVVVNGDEGVNERGSSREGQRRGKRGISSDKKEGEAARKGFRDIKGWWVEGWMDEGDGREQRGSQGKDMVNRMTWSQQGKRESRGKREEDGDEIEPRPALLARSKVSCVEMGG